MRVTSAVQPQATISRKIWVQGTSRERAHRSTVMPSIAATTKAGSSRKEVGPHSTISDARAPTASWEVTRCGPRGVRQAATPLSTGTAIRRSAVRRSGRRSSRMPAQHTTPTTRPVVHRPWAVAHTQVSGTRCQGARRVSAERSHEATTTASSTRLTT